MSITADVLHPHPMHVAVSKTDLNVQRSLKTETRGISCASDTRGICTYPFSTYKIITINDFQHVTVNRWRLAEVFSLKDSTVSR